MNSKKLIVGDIITLDTGRRGLIKELIPQIKGSAYANQYLFYDLDLKFSLIIGDKFTVKELIRSPAAEVLYGQKYERY